MCPNNRIIPIRPHHGMCLAYYVGQGYSDGFNRHMGEMLEHFLKDPAVRLTVAADEVCAACPNNGAKGCVTQEKVERYDRAVLAACGLEEGESVSFLAFARMVQEQVIAAGMRETICGDCQWTALCRGAGRWAKLN